MPGAQVDWASLSAADVQRLTRQRSHCSFLARFTPDMQDVIAAHTTWSGYNGMLRQFKQYTFPDPFEPGAVLL